jgi:hypothetical protein
MFSKLKKSIAVFLIVPLATIYAGYAQQTSQTASGSDTTVLEQLKEDVGDNIPVISLDENDAQDQVVD